MAGRLQQLDPTGLALAKAFRLLGTPSGWTMYETPQVDGDLAYDGDEQIADEG